MIALGDKVRDMMTGFEGIATGTTTFLHGCKRIAIQSAKLHDGKPIDLQWFDEPQVELVEKKNVPAAPPAGGPQHDPMRSSSQP